MKNKLVDLNNHLFAEIERLSDEDLKGKELAKEIRRARAVAGLAAQVINNGRLALEAQRLLQGGEVPEIPKMIANGKQDDGKDS